MNIRESHEKLEEQILSTFACLSSKAERRGKYEEKCDIRTEFQRDRDRILHSKAFRRLKHKTQVFIAPEGDHYRTRLTHTLEVSQIARTIARAIRMNEDLVEAIALGHDLGHTPFGHTGEKILNSISSVGFRHNEQSLRVVDYLERQNGLNLTEQVRDGILCHSGDLIASTYEGRIVKLADKIAYINHDIDDAVRASIISIDDLPKECIQILGPRHSERLNKMITRVITNAVETNEIALNGEIGEATWKLRDYMFEHVYIGSQAKKEEEKAMKCVEQIYNYYIKEPDKLPSEFYERISIWGLEVVVCDYIAGMTDRYAIFEYTNLFIPSPWGKNY